MKEAFWAYFLVVLGLFIIIVLLLIQRMTVTTEEDFYLGREALEASMIDAVDYGTYRTSGKLVMSKEKFVEVFIRRFAESVTNNKTYQLDFYDISEEPPKASVRIRTTSGTTEIDSNSFVIGLDTNVSGILETIYGLEGGDGNTTKTDSITVVRYANKDGGSTYYTNSDLTGQKKTLPKCSVVKITYSESIEEACKYGGTQYCKANYGGSTIYVNRMDLGTANPAGCTNNNPVGTGNWTQQYYSIAYIGINDNRESYTYSIQLNKTKNGDSAITAKKCSVVNNSASPMTSLSEVETYRDNKANGDMEFLGGSGNGDTKNMTAEYVWNHSATIDNFTVQAVCSIVGDNAVITINDIFTGTKVNDSKVVKEEEGYHYKGGGVVKDIYFLPIKYKIIFTY